MHDSVVFATPPAVADFALVAILKETYDAIVEFCDLKAFDTREGYQWAWGIVPGRDGIELTIVTGHPVDRENLAAATFVGDLLRAWTPRNVLLVDIGGGVKGRDDIQLGDVVVHTHLHYYDFCKEGQGCHSPRYTSLPAPSTYLRELSRRPAARRDSSWLKTISVERPGPGTSKVVQGEMLSGGALLSSGPRLKRLLAKHEKVLMVEMEAAGAGRAIVDSGLRHAPPEYLVVRGVSDFCNDPQEENQATRELWRQFAVHAAAAHAAAIIREAASGRMGRRVRQDSVSSLPPLLAPESLPFGLRLEVAGQKYEVSQLPELSFVYRRLAVIGRAGGGKTIAVLRALRPASSEIFVAFVGRDGWTERVMTSIDAIERQQGPDGWRLVIDSLLREAFGEVTIGEIEKIAAEHDVIVAVDGLNGVPASIANCIMDALDEAVRHLHLSVVVVDRSDTKYPERSRWTVGRMIELDAEVPHVLIDERYGDGIWNSLDSSSRCLLRSPFFLDLALRGAKLRSATRSEALGDFVNRQARLGTEIVVQISAATAAAYGKGSRRLPPDSLSIDAIEALVDSGIATRSDGPRSDLSFTHDLFGDYFASLHLAAVGEDWQPAELATISFTRERWQFEGLSADAESFDAITLAAEQMPSRGVGDSYLRAVYDWNWRAAVDCLAATDPVEGPFSTPSRLAVLGLLVERRSDPVDGTRRRATRLLQQLPDAPARELALASEPDARAMIASSGLEDEWFNRWLAVFCREPERPWEDSELDAICDPDALLGWTVSYVLKRRPIPKDASTRLQGIYRGLRVGANSIADLGTSIRWRIIHSVAVAEEERVLDLLLSALDDDPYAWVRWGAARSITEFAARATCEYVTARVIDELTLRVSSLPESTWQEIAWVSRYRGASAHFPKMMEGLLQGLEAHLGSESARARWSQWVGSFKEFWKEAL